MADIKNMADINNMNVAAAPTLKSRRRGSKSKMKEVTAKIIFIVCALFSIVAVLGITGYILYGSVPALREVGVFNFLFGTLWSPEYGKYGILPMIVNSVIVTFGAAVIGGTVGVFTAVFLSYWCPEKFHLEYKGKNKAAARVAALINKINLRAVFDQVIKLLAGIPSIIYGLFGLEVLVPFLANMNSAGIGQGILACSILLSVMIIPTVASLSKNAIEAVPQSYYEGALALGNTKAQAVFRAVVPAARSGIVSSLILGIGRAMGEAMAVIWISGNRTLFPTGLFSYIRTLTTNIVMEMGYATDIHRSALIATGLVLLIFILIITLSLNLVPKDFKGKRGVKKLTSSCNSDVKYLRKGKVSEGLKIFAAICAALVAICLAAVVIYIVINGIANFSFDFFFSKQQIDTPTFAPAFFATLELIAISLVIALPIGIGAAIYLHEYAKPDSRPVKIIRTFIDTLSGIPSIVFGLFGNIVFARLLGGSSVLAGALTMTLVVLPTVIRSTEESLHAVPMTLREASYGLGANKVRTIFKVVLPSAFPGIATASILSIGRILGESAALVFTMGTTLTFTGNPAERGSSFTVLLYYCANEGLYMGQAYMLALILLIFSILLNLAVYAIQKRVKKSH